MAWRSGLVCIEMKRRLEILCIREAFQNYLPCHFRCIATINWKRSFDKVLVKLTLTLFVSLVWTNTTSPAQLARALSDN